MPNIEALVAYLYENGIRTGVISNIGFSGQALKSRIDHYIPENHFEFIIASSEYMIRKPHPMIFELALRKADLPANDAWHCGDSVFADIEGAAGVGIFPVWYENTTIENPFPSDKKPDCAHLHIQDWSDLIAMLGRI